MVQSVVAFPSEVFGSLASLPTCRYNDIHGQDHIVRMLDFFVYRRHLCIVFELLSVNLYEVRRPAFAPDWIS